MNGRYQQETIDTLIGIKRSLDRIARALEDQNELLHVDACIMREEGQDALREEIWERERDRLD